MFADTQRLDDVLAETLAAVDVPVVAAGGVGTVERVAALLAAGAAAVRVGTRFVVAEEADAHPLYVQDAALPPRGKTRS